MSALQYWDGLVLTEQQRPTKPLYHSTASKGQGRWYHVGPDKDRERSLTSYHHGKNRLNWGNQFSSQIRVGLWEVKPRLKTPGLTPRFLPDITLFSILYLLSLPSAQQDREWACVHFITCCHCFYFLLPERTPHALPLLQWVVSPTEAVLLALLQHESFSQDAVFHEVFQSSMLCRPSGTESQVLPANLQHRLLQGLQVDLYFTMNLHGFQGHSCFTMVCTTGCRPSSKLCSSTCSMFSPFYWPWSLAGLFPSVSHVFSFLSSLACFA